MANFTMMSRELSLHEMLTDPIVQTMMARDGVKKEDVESLFAALRERAVD